MSETQHENILPLSTLMASEGHSFLISKFSDRFCVNVKNLSLFAVDLSLFPLQVSHQHQNAHHCILNVEWQTTFKLLSCRNPALGDATRKYLKPTNPNNSKIKNKPLRGTAVTRLEVSRSSWLT